jgi:DNA polymerase I-like protein with 3'-5' exonuclease and polymerase domains
MNSRVVMVIHDAVYVEAPQEEAQEVIDLMKEQMGSGRGDACRAGGG